MDPRARYPADLLRRLQDPSAAPHESCGAHKWATLHSAAEAALRTRHDGKTVYGPFYCVDCDCTFHVLGTFGPCAAIEAQPLHRLFCSSVPGGTSRQRLALTCALCGAVATVEFAARALNRALWLKLYAGKATAEARAAALVVVLRLVRDVLDGDEGSAPRIINLASDTFAQSIGSYKTHAKALFEALGFVQVPGQSRCFFPLNSEASRARLGGVLLPELLLQLFAQNAAVRSGYVFAQDALLACLGDTRRASAAPPDALASYSVLGCAPAMTANQLLLAYLDWTRHDRSRAPVYFEAIKSLALARPHDDTLQVQVSIDASCGAVTESERRSACKTLQLDPDDAGLWLAHARDCYANLCAIYPNKRRDLAHALDVLVRAAAMPASESPGTGGTTATVVSETIVKPTGRTPVGLANTGNTCYLNVLLQILYSLEPFRAGVLQKDVGEIGGAAQANVRFFEMLQKLFRAMDASTSVVVPDSALETTLFADANHSQAAEEDAGECLERMLDRLEAVLGGSAASPSALFGGESRTRQLDHQDSLEAAPSSSRFNALICSVAPTFELALDRLFSPERVATGLQRLELVRAPPFLFIQFNRAQFNPETRTAFKDNAFVRLPRELNLGPYFDARRAPATERRLYAALAESATRDDALESLWKLETAAKVLDRFGAADYDAVDKAATADTAGKLRDILKTISTQLSAAEAASASAAAEHRYVLHAVVFHSGNAGSGHYYAFIAAPNSSDSFFKFNDSTVSVEPASVVFQDTSGQAANVSLVLYRRE